MIWRLSVLNLRGSSIYVDDGRGAGVEFKEEKSTRQRSSSVTDIR